MKTFSAKAADVQQKWFVVDAEDQVLGRLASNVAKILRGKHKPIFTPHVDTGDNVIIVNAAKIRVTGNKEEQKEYFTHTGYMGNDRQVPFRTMMRRKPEWVVERAIFGMLPKSTLARQRLRRKLRVYAGSDHPHGAQQPTVLTFDKSETK
jgi:large subunit ribosomal protein L13